MPVTYSNIIFDNIIETLSLLIQNEFNIKIYYDEHRGNQSFLLTPASDEFVTFLSSGQQREYNVEVSYQLKIGGQRLKRVIHNNSSYSNGSTWFDANISNIEYSRDEEDQTLLQGIGTFNCNKIEVT